ncbi:aldo/keto reductase [Pseudomassariella vexata]|uniref:Aldo/keto reductase n=1 Tax=Pseudomassariella vexata TaxID=1141098 RepID=A0A1Y2DJT1_9PEZI|nr:aldo/keto reductase [Pseudomassariella vexata]ORY59490.1 aldo/keto reductase [Pseudomassariella vexata]
MTVIFSVLLFLFFPCNSQFSEPAVAVEQQPGAGIKGIPSIGLGTWLSDKGKVAHATEYALDLGYHHIDAAWIYRNEDQTGKGIAASKLHRKDIWVTSKLWNSHHRPAEAERAVKESISNLGVGYLDLYLMHWPVSFIPNSDGNQLDKSVTILDTWRTMEGLVRANYTRHIGISNFAKVDVEAILEMCTICPYAHEFETHPYLQQQEFVDYHREIGLKVIAYSPLANTNPVYNRGLPYGILEDPLWTGLAEKKNVTAAQAVLAWGIQRGTMVIPRSVKESHIAQNLRALEIEFTKREMEDIAKADKKVRLSNPGKKWGVPLFHDLDDPTMLDGETKAVEL